LQDEQYRPTASLIDIGTGSGCIAIALAKHWLQATVQATDISQEALAIARQNAARLQVPVQFWHSSILEPTRWPDGRFHIIVSNPPYIPQQESRLLEAHVAKWEPGLALFVPDDDPLLFYRRIAAFAQERLLPGGRVYFECHQSYASQVAALLSSMGFATTLRHDVFGNERMVRGEMLM
jgi:release factor glutamine methyltransferase